MLPCFHIRRRTGIDVAGLFSRHFDSKADQEYKIIPVIVFTADHEAEVECLKAGAVDFIPKPYPMPPVIKARVDRSIELSEDRDIIRSTERDSLTKLFNPNYFMRYVRMYLETY